MFLFTLLFMQAMYRSLSYDIELEGAVHIGKDLVRRFNDIIPKESKSMKYSPLIQLTAAEPIPRSNKEVKDELEVKALKPIKEDMQFETEKHYEMDVEPTEDPGKFKMDVMDVQNVKFRFILIQQLSTSGSLRLKLLASSMKNHLNPESNIDSALNNSTKDYLSVVNAYYVFISKKPIKYDIDKEFVVLDMIETTNQILLHEAKKLLDAIMKVAKPNKAQADMTMLMEEIKNTVLEEKQHQLKYVCRVLNVCRTFPGYCDHIADMLSQLLQLTDKSFKDIILTLNETITTKRDFFKTIMRDDIYNKLSKKLYNSINNVNFIREVFSVIRAVVTHRYKVFKSNSLMITVKTKAVRILLDLIDNAFEVNDNDVSYIDIENTKSSYKQWALGERDDVGMITKKFIYNAVEILNYFWGRETKEEVKVLTEVMFTGGTENVGVYEYLFTKGPTLNRDFV